MRAEQLVSIAFFTIAVVLTAYVWSDRWAGRNAAVQEAFANPDNSPGLTAADLERLSKINEEKPTAQDAEKAYRTLLLFIKNDFGTGVKFVLDMGERFFGTGAIRKDFDYRTLTDNWRSPLQNF